MSLFKAYARVLTYLKKEKNTSLLICAANVMLAIITIAEPILFGRVIDSIAEKSAIILTLTIWVCFGISHIIAYVLVARSADRLTHRHRLAVLTESFERIIAMPLSWHQQRGTSNALHILLRAIDSMSAIWLDFMRQHLSTLVALFILIPIAFNMNWRLSIVLVVLAIIYVLIARLVMRKTKDGQAAVECYHHNLFQHVSDSISNVSIVQSYNRIREETSALHNYTNDLLKAQNPVLNWWALASGLNRTASTISIVCVLLLGAFFVAKGQLRVGEVVAFVGFAQLMISRLDQMSNFINLTVSSQAKLQEFFSMEDSTFHINEPENLPCLQNVKGTVQFHHVTYKFPNSSQGVFDISFKVKTGQTVAIVGPTGAGKTTLINLLQRVYEPTFGHISIDGINIRSINRESLRKSLATVFQDAGLFNRSIHDNILIGRATATNEELYEAAKIAAAHDFILKKTDRYNTMVGERGSQLSGGEKQRLAIARAVLKNAPILILDEATSALDVETEARVKDALDCISHNRTTFIIAHRLSTVRHADLVLFLENGHLIEKGNFQELIDKGGRFYKLLKAGGLIIDQPTIKGEDKNVIPLREAIAS
ncbi:glucan ABC transporter ATP-binding protein/ permease [Bartonella quintana]|uniref:Beta-(1-->2)glucan export ATP-binding/permease protein NdvA n=3 Tax=Bartonella quintana TaxID=803 RepID=NDVA_BARQU|nr:glucan ABC transporter ATP-binding protein/ permease [Bartonella quintana]Q6FZF2.1 RecName: Full=Beta-(1-->2)glucan export ATP-binding/permease protein NdvA [Bartonella quintana str. Toulouse]ETS13198.1 beta-(1-2)glucan export ATP-binding/permease NdvA [Bartonella quintana BQ2-D70]ETS14145.1 beta-(1-2)glucan export ATP-binding/permease NdvA [Bartonella quintana JK 73rel]ETS15832.1 beta-(1-2)glucan export ATP-binding/permease NdvA [Bartonella quintana JK 73]ETS17835.1 beta-(1-2)glucan export